MLRNYVRSIKNLTLHRSILNASAVTREFCEKIEKNETEPAEADTKLSGFAKAFEKHSAPHLKEDKSVEKRPDLPFATLLRNSKFIDVSLNLNKFPS